MSCLQISVSLSHAALLGMCLLPRGSRQGACANCQSHRACGFLVGWLFFPGGGAAGLCAAEEQNHEGGGVQTQPVWGRQGKAHRPAARGSREGRELEGW